MKLLIDIGNTRLKWALARDGQFIDSGATVHGGEPARTITQLPASNPAAVWIAHVMGATHEHALIDAIQSHCKQAPSFARSSAEWRGLRNAYREPQRLGVDRWLAMIAGWHAQRGAACIANAGTALTVDVIAADGRHLGGIIAAGLAAQQRAVLGTTRFEMRAAHVDSDNLLGTDTESCVRQGAQLCCAGAIDRAASLAEMGALHVLTGGDASTLLPGLKNIWQHRPHLVLEGLAAWADAPARAL